jgi:hypothetical protein
MMRLLSLAAAAAAALALTAPAEACCHWIPSVYVGPPFIPGGYEFAPPTDQASQIYVVNQGPVLSGPGIYTYTNPYVPTLAPPLYPTAYPYVRHVPHRICPGCGGFATIDPRSFRQYGFAPHIYRGGLR